MIAGRRHWIRSFALWLSLVVVLTCALGSFGSAVQASSGSAFNAFTSDVSLGPSRASEPEKAKALPLLVALLAPPQPAPLLHHSVDSLTPPIPVTVGAVGARAPPQP